MRQIMSLKLVHAVTGTPGARKDLIERGRSTLPISIHRT